MRNEEYLKSGGVNCPYCNNSAIEGGTVDIQGGSALQTVSCLKCEAEWQDKYVLIEFTKTRDGKERP